MILLWTPLFPEGKGQTNHADACEKFVCPKTGPCGHPETGKGHFSGCTFRTLEPEYGGHMSLFSFFSDFQPTSPQWPSRNPDSVPLRKILIYLQNDTVFHCFQDSGGPPGICQIPGAIFNFPEGLRKKKFKIFEQLKFSAAARYLVTEKKPVFFGFRFPDGHKVPSKARENAVAFSRCRQCYFV